MVAGPSSCLFWFSKVCFDNDSSFFISTCCDGWVLFPCQGVALRSSLPACGWVCGKSVGFWNPWLGPHLQPQGRTEKGLGATTAGRELQDAAPPGRSEGRLWREAGAGAIYRCASGLMVYEFMTEFMAVPSMKYIDLLCRTLPQCWLSKPDSFLAPRCSAKGMSWEENWSSRTLDLTWKSPGRWLASNPGCKLFQWVMLGTPGQSDTWFPSQLQLSLI